MKRLTLCMLVAAGLCRPVLADVRINNATRKPVMVQVDFMAPQGKVKSTATQSIAPNDVVVLAGHSEASDHAVKIRLDGDPHPGLDGHQYDIRYDNQGHVILFEPQQ